MLALKAEGVKTIFGYPGGSIMPVYDALYDYTRGEKKAFDHILVRHEQAAWVWHWLPVVLVLQTP